MAKNEESFCLYDNVYRGSKKINIKSSFDEYRNLIQKSEFKDYFRVKEDLTERMQLVGEKVVEKESYDILADYCDPKHLTVNGEVEKLTKYSFEWCKDPMDPSVLDDIKLKTYICTKKRNSMKAYKKPLKYRSEKPVVGIRIVTKIFFPFQILNHSFFFSAMNQLVLKLSHRQSLHYKIYWFMSESTFHIPVGLNKFLVQCKNCLSTML